MRSAEPTALGGEAALRAILDAVECHGMCQDDFGLTETQSTIIMPSEIFFARSNALCCTLMHPGALYWTINAYYHWLGTVLALLRQRI